ncbi:MAG: hypothetical protein HY773_00490 [Candidatus Terrybacteria bacterium]|nr:hypothetical protein [Candidatus Terrybacteria bacterium]
MKNKITEILGWYGVVAIVAAYIMVTFSFIKPTDLLYLILNGTGAVGIVADAFNDKNYQPVVLNLIWAVVAIVAIIKLII